MKRVEKSWGHELWIHNDSDYCGKRIFVRRGEGCGTHFHKLKKETFYVESGEMEFWLDGQYMTLFSGYSVEVPRETRHKFRAVVDTVFFEFSTEHFDSDTYRK